jgi:hypothetical protein
MTSDSPSDEVRVFQFFLILTAVCAAAAVTRFYAGDATGGVCFLIGTIAAFLIALKWRWLGELLGPRVASWFQAVRTPRFWRGAVFLSALCAIVWMMWSIHVLRDNMESYVMPRTVSERQANELCKILAEHESFTVTVKWNGQDQEASVYAGQLNGALAKAKWTVLTDTTDRPPAIWSPGLCVEALSPNGQSPPNTKDDPALLLERSLENANIPDSGCGGSTNQTGEYKLYLLVGRRSSELRHEAVWVKHVKQWIRTQVQW